MRSTGSMGERQLAPCRECPGLRRPGARDAEDADCSSSIAVGRHPRERETAAVISSAVAGETLLLHRRHSLAVGELDRTRKADRCNPRASVASAACRRWQPHLPRVMVASIDPFHARSDPHGPSGHDHSS